LIEILEQELPEDPMEMSQHWVLTP
jgi:hypothetical protein